MHRALPLLTALFCLLACSERDPIPPFGAGDERTTPADEVTPATSDGEQAADATPPSSLDATDTVTHTETSQPAGFDSSETTSPNDTSPTPPPLCGNGTVDPGEACDSGSSPQAAWCRSDCLELLDTGTFQPYPAHASVQSLTTSNGLTASVWTQGRVDRLMGHAYAAYGPETPTLDYLYDHYFGLSFGQEGTWLSDLSPTEATYVPGTHILRVTYELDGVRATIHWWTPFAGPENSTAEVRSLVGVVRLEALAGAVHNLRLATLWNAHAGGEGDALKEVFSIDTKTGVITERGATATLAYHALGPGPPAYSAGAPGGPHHPWTQFQEGESFNNTLPLSAVDDGVLGFEFTVASPLLPGASEWFGVVGWLDETQPEAVVRAELIAWLQNRTAPELLEAELAWWEHWHAQSTLSPNLSPQEKAVAHQSLAVLKMAQVREDADTNCPSDRCAGQLLASLVPGQWNISWVRDAVYAAIALARSGHLPEARASLDFMLQALPAPSASGGNHYQEAFIESGDSSPGVWGLNTSLPAPYLISLARYYGQGLEESDANAAGPNLEWDNWGLFLWAFAEVAGMDSAWGDAQIHTVATRVAAPLIALVSPENGLLVPDSSIWERHWCPHGQCAEPETRKQHAYSSIMAAQGLRQLQQAFPQHPEALVWEAIAGSLLEALYTELVVTVPTTDLPALAGNVEELPYAVYYLDTAVVEAIALGLVPAGGPEAFGTFAALDAHLRVGSHSPGYRRNDDPTWYDTQEWVVMDLRAAVALERMGQIGRAETLLAWVTDLATLNHGLIPELLSDGVYQPGSEDEAWQPGLDAGADYQGAIPMCGFGPGAYLLALEALRN